MKLKIINSQTNEELQEFDLASAIRTNGKCIVGRSATSGLVLESSDISRNHAEFSYNSGKYYFADTGSSNGSLINNQVATKNRAYLLKAGDVIHLGDFLLIPQPIAGVYEDATVIAPIAFTSLSNASKPSVSETSSSPEIIHEIAQAQPAAEAAAEEISAAMTAEPEHMEQSDIDDIPNEEAIEDSSAQVTDVVEASTPPEVAAESGTTQMPDAIVSESNWEDSSADDIPNEEAIEDSSAQVTDVVEASTPPEVAAESGTTQMPDAIVSESNWEDSSADDIPNEEAIEDSSAQVTDEATTLQESISLEAMAESDTADTPAATTEKPDWEESHTDTTLAEELVEENAAAVAEELVPLEVAQASTVEESQPFTPAASTPTENVEAEAAELTENTHSTPTENVEAEAAELTKNTYSTPIENVEAKAAELTENTHIQTSPPEFIDKKSSDAIVSPINEATDEELSDRNDISAVPEILKEKYIVLLAHDSQKAELVNFIERHQTTFSKCMFMAPSAISEALMQHDITVNRKLPNLTAGGYQEVNSAIASKDLLGVIFLRDFFIPQSTQANDEALSRACNVNQVILATNIATAQAFEGYLQHLIASTPKMSLAEGSRQ